MEPIRQRYDGESKSALPLGFLFKLLGVVAIVASGMAFAVIQLMQSNW